MSDLIFAGLCAVAFVALIGMAYWTGYQRAHDEMFDKIAAGHRRPADQEGADADLR